MIVGSSFNATGFGDGRWNTDSGVSTSTDPTTFHGVPSEKLSYSASGKGSAGVSNRGLGNEGELSRPVLYLTSSRSWFRDAQNSAKATRDHRRFS